MTDLLAVETKRALAASKLLWQTLHAIEEQDQDNSAVPFRRLKRLALDTNRAVQKIQRTAHMESVRGEIRETLLREAIRNDLVDRDAHAARIADRQRAVLEQCCDSSLPAFERASAAAERAERSIHELCPHGTRLVSVGVAAMARLSQSESLSTTTLAPTPATGPGDVGE